jgi:hypothetical protein
MSTEHEEEEEEELCTLQAKGVDVVDAPFIDLRDGQESIPWESFVPVQEIGSRPITIQFLCTLQEEASGISFRLHGVLYRVSWKDLSCTLRFRCHCAVPLEQACSDFNRESFWEELSS